MQRNNILELFYSFLKRSQLSDQSIRTYKYTVEKFLAENPDGYRASYSEILNYLEGLNRYEICKVTKQSKLTALKKFYDFLIEAGQRDDHPCKTIYLKTSAKKNIIHADLFSMNELESLLEREEHFSHMKLKNQVVISLLIYQGLLSGEICNIRLHHLDLDSGSLYVNSGRRLTARKLPLMDQQIELLIDYIYNHRPRLLLKEKHDFLITNYQGFPEKVDDINYLIETMKNRFPDRNLNPKVIRDSVISYWINVKRIPVEQVQLLAGHRWISSTLRYKQVQSKEARETLNRYFPL